MDLIAIQWYSVDKMGQLGAEFAQVRAEGQLVTGEGQMRRLIVAMLKS